MIYLTKNYTVIASNWIDAVPDISERTIDVVNNTVKYLQEAKLMADILYFNPISPDSLQAARYDIIDPSTPGIINGTLNHTNTGVAGNGTNGFLDIVRNGVTEGWDIGDFGVTWSVSNNIQSGTDIGVAIGGNQLRLKSRDAFNNSFYYGKFRLLVGGVTDSRGIRTMTSNATTTFGYRNGVEVGTDSIGSQGMPNSGIYAWALCDPSGDPVVTDFSAHEINSILFHKHLIVSRVILLRKILLYYNSNIILGGR